MANDPGDEAGERIVRELIKQMFRKKTIGELIRLREALGRFSECADAIIAEKKRSEN